MAEEPKTTKNYAKSEGIITLCACRGMPPEDIKCEFCPEERKRRDNTCLYYTQSMEHCGSYEAQKEVKK